MIPAINRLRMSRESRHAGQRSSIIPKSYNAKIIASVPTAVTIIKSRTTSTDPIMTDIRRSSGEAILNATALHREMVIAKAENRLKSCHAWASKTGLRAIVTMMAISSARKINRIAMPNDPKSGRKY